MSIQLNRSCSRYITSMATLLLRWTSCQVITVKLYTHVLIGDQCLVEDTTCTYPTTLQATAVPTPSVATPTPSPLGTLHFTFPVDFMQVDPMPTSLPLMLKCFTRQQLKPCKGRSRLPPIQAEYKPWTFHSYFRQFLTSTGVRIRKYWSMFGFPWKNPSVNSQWYIENECSDVA